MASSHINVELLIVLVQERPELWDQRDPNYSNRTRKEASWKTICVHIFPDYNDRSREDQERLMNDVTRRWRSCRDCYRRERQIRDRSGASASKKRKYLYFDRLNFLEPVLELRPTESNLTERETGSDSEVVIDPVGDGEEEAGPSSAACGSTHAAPTTAAGVEDSQTLHVETEDLPQSSSPNRAQEVSPPTSQRTRRGRRRREGVGAVSRRQVDRGVLDYLSSVGKDDGEEAFCRSLAPYLRATHTQHRLRIRSGIQILLEAGSGPNDPTNILDYLHRWVVSPENLFRLEAPNPAQSASASDPHPPPHHHHPPPPPPPCLAQNPTPPPPPPTVPHSLYGASQLQTMGQSGHAQCAHSNIPNVVGWPQHGYVRHGHIGGPSASAQSYQYDYEHQFPMYPYPQAIHDAASNPAATVGSAAALSQTQVADCGRPNTQTGPPSSPTPPPSYHQL